MGYTHYMYQTRDLTEDEWRAFTKGFERLLTLDGVPPLSRIDEDFEVPPEITNELICFNGVGDDSHETCVVYRTKTDGITGEPSDREEVFSFTKTARKPYDVVVTAVYAYLESSFPDAFHISTDGEERNWVAGVTLAQRAWPEIDIGIPRRCRDDYDEDADAILASSS